MKIHEYQGKALFAKYGVPIPKGLPAFSVEEARQAAERLIAETGSEVVVVKAQIHAGGRGKGGGVKVCKGAAEAQKAAEKLLGMQLVTHQTAPEGQTVRRLFVEQGLAIARELYLGLVVDRDRRRIAIMASTEGGVDIEEVAAKHPEKILTEHVDPAVGIQAYQARNLGFALGLEAAQVKQLGALLASLYRLVVEEDCSLLEVNPLITTKDGSVVALDAKVNFDDNADFRHPGWASLKDKDEEDATELEATAAGLSYVSLQGNIGCLVNGAGLAMSTMDIIKHYGGQPANFLDVGGGATQEAVTKAFTIILQDKDVKGIFVNIFGGIMKCDIIAGGVIAAAKTVGIKVPLVVRLEGTNVELGRKMLVDSGIAITPASSMADGAQKIVELVRAQA